MYDFATDHFWIFLYIRRIWFCFFISVAFLLCTVYIIYLLKQGCCDRIACRRKHRITYTPRDLNLIFARPHIHHVFIILVGSSWSQYDVDNYSWSFVRSLWSPHHPHHPHGPHTNFMISTWYSCSFTWSAWSSWPPVIVMSPTFTSLMIFIILTVFLILSTWPSNDPRY